MKPDWKDAPEWARWLCWDSTCGWAWHEYAPELMSHGQNDEWWINVGGRVAVVAHGRPLIEARP